MSVPLSVGDFVACISLITKVVSALHKAPGSAQEFRGLIGQLRSFEKLPSSGCVDTRTRAETARTPTWST